ncbi:hypothetical protein GCM10025864_11490 [Luteimicrobium album]|uniref:Bacterial proteasome activator n=1 Tax=Luteimicrobium album TaxID=1054550 RepID=A0ABQ6HYA3_9MICO|nr:hypothetical protein GCM10025864_11490 [Luteimicrobium album]
MPDDAEQQVPAVPDTDDERAEREAEQAAEDAVREAAAAQVASQLVLPPGVSPSGDGAEETNEERTSIEEPAKVMRIGTMIKRLLDEVRESPLDEAARARLASIHERSLHELEDGLSPT